MAAPGCDSYDCCDPPPVKRPKNDPQFCEEVCGCGVRGNASPLLNIRAEGEHSNVIYLASNAVTRSYQWCCIRVNMISNRGWVGKTGWLSQVRWIPFLSVEVTCEGLFSVSLRVRRSACTELLLQDDSTQHYWLKMGRQCLLPLELADCLTDSPHFRQNLHAYEKELENTSSSIKSLVKDIKEVLDAAKREYCAHC